MHRSSLVVLATALALAATACGSGNTTTTGGSSPAGTTLTVWLMDGDLSDKAIAAIDDAFKKATGAKVTVQIQEWDNINTKISPPRWPRTTPPDVLEIGNTDVPLFAANGALADITAHQAAAGRRTALAARPGRPGHRGRQALRRTAVRRQPRGDLQQADLGRRPASPRRRTRSPS